MSHFKDEIIFIDFEANASSDTGFCRESRVLQEPVYLNAIVSKLFV